ncbi:unnamed protein product [Notodromas monacha]|uniref:Uncharacterized protein n=1 Tax=Notodromas monacha TaxID=399045 RepID=A0A7R9GEL2_9CRUS|nr:unnamed protein product [Notodromas monacha]CAG0917993.1 unnamed protein product [Notodromas monacha]
MRLPSYTTQDQKEMIRTLAAPHVAEGEIVMDAEEYLQPREATTTGKMFPSYASALTLASRHSALAASSTSTATTGVDYRGLVGTSRRMLHNSGAMGDVGGPSSPASHFGSMVGIPVHDGPGVNFLSMPRQGLIHGSSRTVTPNPVFSDRSVGVPRYEATGPSSLTYGLPQRVKEPLQSLPHEVELHGTTGGPGLVGQPGETHIYQRRRANVGDLKLSLPPEVEDYLVPSPMGAGGTRSGGGGGGSSSGGPPSAPPSAGYSPQHQYHNQLLHHHNSMQTHPGFHRGGANGPVGGCGGGGGATLIDNPEYHVVSTTSSSCSTASFPIAPRRSSGGEESDDHEYYNEVDRLKGELRPLHPSGLQAVSPGGRGRNETTV